MLLYDITSLLLVGIGHVYLFKLFLSEEKISLFSVTLIGSLFIVFLNLALIVTGLVELNIIVLCLFLTILGMMERKYGLWQVVYFSMISIVLFTVSKNVLFQLLYKLYMESPFNYYIWTPSLLQFCTLGLLILVLFLGRNGIRNAGIYLIQSKLYWVTYAVLVICTVLLLIVNYPTIQLLAQLNLNYGSQLYSIVLYTALLLMTVIALTTYISKKRLMKQYEKAKQAQLMEYIEKLEFLHDELATFRHDYSNILLSLEQSIRENNMAQVSRIYEQTIAPTATTMNLQQLELTKLARISQPELKSMLSVKTLSSQRKGLNVYLDVPEPIVYDAMPMDELLRVVSVLFDNAVEAAEASTDKLVQVAFFHVDHQQYIVVKNSVGAPNVDVESLFSKEFSTKGTSRGLGLFSLQRIVQKYPNVTLTTKIDAAMFTQELLMKPLVKK